MRGNTLDPGVVLNDEITMRTRAPVMNAVLAIEENIQPCSEAEALLRNLLFDLYCTAKV